VGRQKRGKHEGCTLTEERQDQGAELTPRGIERRSGREHRKGIDAEFFSGGGIERRSGIEPRRDAAGAARNEPTGPMKLRIRCGWCQSEMGEERFAVVDDRLPAVSHGICPVCNQRVFGKRLRAVMPSDSG
jgi:hypothetical protein